MGLRRAPGDPGRVTYAELFFDLIFVFAITQISHGLLHHPGLVGAIETLILFGAVWWVWIYTAWATNWLDPERGAVRGMLFAMMAAGLVMAVALPRAWEGTGLVFACAHVAMQLGRTAFVWWGLGPADPAQRRNFLRIGIWLAAAAPLWILGTLAMWWVYFDRGSASGARHAAETERQERMSRLGYTYLHAAIVGGIVLAAAGDERLLAHPEQRADLFSGVLLLGGPALFLLGVGFFKRIWMGWFQLSHRVGLGLLAALVPAALFVNQATLALLATLAVAVTAAWERLSLGQPERHEA